MADYQSLWQQSLEKAKKLTSEQRTLTDLPIKERATRLFINEASRAYEIDFVVFPRFVKRELPVGNGRVAWDGGFSGWQS